MPTASIATTGTLYLGGHAHGFPPGSTVAVPRATADALVATGLHAHADPAAPAPRPDALEDAVKTLADPAAAQADKAAAAAVIEAAAHQAAQAAAPA